MRWTIIRLTALLLILGSAVHPAHCQSVGLVLSGGGAKGISHIGVIRALEEYEIPIDYITGTSMGAIIGGLYASGCSPEEMLALISSKEFPNWVSGEIDERYLFYFKEKYANASWLDLKFNYDSLVLPTLLPTNLISPHQMDFAFMEIFSGPGAAASYNFDSLMVGFRCVAADIASDSPLVLKSGDLGSAIRASMTFPFYFKPIRIEGKLLFDGGMYNNFPADVMSEEFNPDILIGSKAASNYGPPKEDNVISQLQTMLMAKTEYSLGETVGVIIAPNLPPMGVTDFTNAQSLIDSGYNATLRVIAKIRSLIPRHQTLKEINEKRAKFRSKIPPIYIDSLKLQGTNRKQSQYLRKSLVHKEMKVSLREMKPAYFKLIADDKIQAIFPRLEYMPGRGTYCLNMVVEKEKNILAQIGGNISSKPINEAFFGLEYKYLGNQAVTLSLNSYIGRFYSSGQISARLDYPSRKPYYLEGTISFNQWDYFKTTTYFFEDKYPSYLIQNDNHFDLGIGIPFKNTGKILGGVTLAHLRNDYYQTNQFSRKDTADKSYFDLIAGHIILDINSLNNKKAYANKGLNLFMEMRYVIGSEENIPGSTATVGNNTDSTKTHHWLQFHFLYQNYFAHLGRLSLGYNGEFLLSNQGFFQNYTSSVLIAPAYHPIPESKSLFLPTYRAHNYFSSGLQFVVSLSRKIDLRFEGYVFQPFQELIRQENFTTDYGEPFAKRYFLQSSALVIHTALGPISLSMNYYEKSDDQFSFIFNFGYILFNRRALE